MDFLYNAPRLLHVENEPDIDLDLNLAGHLFLGNEYQMDIMKSHAKDLR